MPKQMGKLVSSIKKKKKTVNKIITWGQIYLEKNKFSTCNLTDFICNTTGHMCY